MPNGGNHTKEEWREVETFFEKISQTLNQFATRFNLVIDKYYHNAADWTFRFAHPLGGDGHIQVMKAGTESVWLALAGTKMTTIPLLVQLSTRHGKTSTRPDPVVRVT
jgi:hypothetical protein